MSDLIERLVRYAALPTSRVASARELCAEAVAALAALAAKDAEIAALHLSLGRVTADMMGMQDGALVRDQAVEIDSLRASAAAKDAEIERAIAAWKTAVAQSAENEREIAALLSLVATLRARLAAAEGAVSAGRTLRRVWPKLAPECVAAEEFDRAVATYDAAKEPPHD